ncbi:hypothetical protein BATDEDRAFT_24946 [Batrachochytrium dendrobatidis JAM81]|uniref:Uncharacterized protein n=1 Tax=Batrachochytrium dendrobatidis (strain JAM81 / FGSC 10211) TaxID=684364 RepID=F4P315_BATDJ|nr:uncharacterized protein BATDEDRAFT_24946 [Batrachochytrium dendrobatidis JAM81]EGF80401.1 hypothetical protein BATDEDRAFT_24946 [Batrachochytrium dendrobatidis JAM81]KAJ8326552.1 hypothetical protein O5D80_005293 [Batrachochytrium dendrobatidis]KAK5666664.1 hypothetical protein QVD99_006727 [Batrachochytrium dendrobatidis]|eukprot:XP_006678969.1 hypothetical protein BATDEDRAFT_24946 [Batrachochytrium dendrobatidis JAM81]
MPSRPSSPPASNMTVARSKIPQALSTINTSSDMSGLPSPLSAKRASMKLSVQLQSLSLADSPASPFSPLLTPQLPFRLSTQATAPNSTVFRSFEATPSPTLNPAPSPTPPHHIDVCKSTTFFAPTGTNLPATGVSQKLRDCLDRQARVAKTRWTNTLGTPISWSALFSFVDHASRTPFESQLYWKLLARRLPVNQYLRTIKQPAASPELEKSEQSVIFRGCSRCDSELESIEHVFFECPPVRAFWSRFRILFGAIVSMSGLELPEITLCDVVLFFPDLRSALCAEELHVLQVMHSVALWSLWGARTMPAGNHMLWQSFTNRLQARISVEYDAALLSRTEADAFSASLLGNSLRGSYTYSLGSTELQDDSSSTTPSVVSLQSSGCNAAHSSLRDLRRYRVSSANSALTTTYEPNTSTHSATSNIACTPVNTVAGFISTWCSGTYSTISVTPQGLHFQHSVLPVNTV